MRLKYFLKTEFERKESVGSRDEGFAGFFVGRYAFGVGELLRIVLGEKNAVLVPDEDTFVCGIEGVDVGQSRISEEAGDGKRDGGGFEVFYETSAEKCLDI